MYTPKLNKNVYKNTNRDEEETVSHFLVQCPAITQIRGVNDVFDNQHISTIVNFVLVHLSLPHPAAIEAFIHKTSYNTNHYPT